MSEKSNNFSHYIINIFNTLEVKTVLTKRHTLLTKHHRKLTRLHTLLTKRHRKLTRLHFYVAKVLIFREVLSLLNYINL